MSNVFFAPICSLLLGQSLCPGMWSHFVPQASRLAKIPIGTLLPSVWSVRCGSVRDQAGEKKVHAATKNPNHLSRSGKCIGKGSEKTTFNPVASPMAPWSGSSLTPLLGSGEISVLSCQHFLLSSIALITSIDHRQHLLSPVHGLAL